MILLGPHGLSSIVTKDDAFGAFKKLAKVIQNEKNCTIVVIKNNHGREFQNERFQRFCKKFCTKHKFSAQELHNKMGMWRGK